MFPSVWFVISFSFSSSGVGRQQRRSAPEASGRPPGAGHQPVFCERRALFGIAYGENAEALQVGVKWEEWVNATRAENQETNLSPTRKGRHLWGTVGNVMLLNFYLCVYTAEQVTTSDRTEEAFHTHRFFFLKWFKLRRRIISVHHMSVISGAKDQINNVCVWKKIWM